MEQLLLGLAKLTTSGSKASVLLSTGISMSSTSKPSMSHGSPPVLVLMVNLATKTTGVHTTSIGPPNSMITHATTSFPTLPKSFAESSGIFFGSSLHV